MFTKNALEEVLISWWLLLQTVAVPKVK